ncbi:MAG: rhodanese-like domain-containing protein [Candidatus Thalassarchaeaceae archaeon]|jgi:rhodanese-related sulfurtransferase|nr:rhodanese-like domain-containing protein [Candidatus Thalassarchaeaceae archaeon]
MRLLAILLLLLLLPGCLSNSGDWARVDVETFDQAISDNPDAFLLDVRTQSEWEQDGHLEDATLIPHTELESRESELPDDKDSLILLYCRSGNRSQTASQTLVDMGFTNLMELEVGITGWKNADKPVVYE